MSVAARVSKNIIFDKTAILHFVLFQKVTVFQGCCNQVIDNDALWIENVEAVQLHNTGYDIARCMETKSPFHSTTKQLDGLPTYSIYREHMIDTKLTLNGRISILKQHNTALESSVRYMNLRFCILQNLGTYSLNAVLHDSSLHCKDISFLLGFSSYTESNLSATFSGITGIAWNLNKNVDNSITSIVNAKNDPTYSNIVTAKATVNADGILDELDEVSKEKIKYIAELTQEQAFTDIWKQLRNKRLTASLFGIVLSAINRNKYPSYLFKSLLNEYSISHLIPVKWGIDNEHNAKLAYEAETGVTVQSTGLWLHASGVLGASPDGLLPDGKGLVEFKCPYSIREMSVEEAIKSNPKFYIKKMEDGTVFLPKNHPYYHQIQGMLYIIGREYCDFCVWTPISLYIMRIDKDPAWEECLAKLINFYFKQFLPHITGNDDEKCLYEGYVKLVGTVDAILDDAKQKRVERKARLTSNERNEESKGYEIADFSAMSADDIVKIAALTSTSFDKFHSKLWYTMREHRLTSSSFHKVLSAVRRDTFSDSLYKTVMSEYYMGNTAVAKFTHASTVKAIRFYEGDTKLDVLPSGIWLDSSKVLGASVTGILHDGKGIVDVRCLYKYKDVSSIREILELNDPNFHLEKGEEGELKVKSTHRIYHKIQGSLYMSRRQYCDNITWTKDIYHVTRVYIDPDWEENLEVLRKFYVEKLFPVLCDKWGYDNVMRDLKRFGD